MPLTGSPPVYTRGYSFTTHSVDQPNVPQPGDKLDQEFDDIATAIGGTAAALDGLTNPDGTLADGIVGFDNLAPGLFDQILSDAQDQLQPDIDAAAASAAAAQSHAAAAQGSASSAAASANVASGAVASTGASASSAATSATNAAVSASAASGSAAAAGNSASTATAAMSQALAYKDLAFQWAEYLAGPVAPAPPGWPEAVDDGQWSAKWWAVRAQEIVGTFGNFYLGAFPSNPPVTGLPWPPGQLYFNTTLGIMMVWNGSQWVPLTAPGPSVQFSFTYKATAGQQDFSGADLFGQVPAVNATTPQPNDVHVNGVRLVQGNATFGDYSVNAATSTLHINVPLTVDSVVQWDLLVPPASLAPTGIFAAYKLTPPAAFDGVTTDFPLTYNLGAGEISTNVTQGAQLHILLDGVTQELGADYTAAVATLHFIQAPPAGTHFYGVWFKPNS